MEHPNSAPVLITGGARRIGLALARAFLQRGVPVIIAYRSEYPAMAELKALGACCIQGDFPRTKASTVSPTRCGRWRPNCAR